MKHIEIGFFEDRLVEGHPSPSVHFRHCLLFASSPLLGFERGEGNGVEEEVCKRGGEAMPCCSPPLSSPHLLPFWPPLHVTFAAAISWAVYGSSALAQNRIGLLLALFLTMLF